MPREKEEFGYAPSNWNVQNMGFPDFLESLDEEIDTIEAGPSVAPNRMFNFAALEKLAEDESAYSIPTPATSSQTANDEPSTELEASPEAAKSIAQDVSSVLPPFRDALKLVQESKFFLEKLAHSTLKREPFTSLLKMESLENWNKISNVPETSLPKTITSVVEKLDFGSKINDIPMAQKIRQKENSQSAEYVKNPYPVIEEISTAFDNILNKKEEDYANKNEGDRAKEIEDMLTPVYKLESLMSRLTPLLNFIRENTVEYGTMVAYDNTSKELSALQGPAVKLGVGKYTIPPGSKWSKAWETAKTDITKVPQVLSEKEEPKIVNTIEVINSNAHHLTLLQDILKNQSSGKKRALKGTRFWIIYPDGEKLHKAFEKARLPYEFEFTENVTFPRSNPGKSIGEQTFTNVVLPSPKPFMTPEGEKMFAHVYVLYHDLVDVDEHTAMNRMFKIYADMFMSPMPGAWREFPETGDTRIDTSPIDRDKPFGSQPQRGAVPFISMPNVGDGLRGNDNSIEKGVAEDAEYADKQDLKVREAYEKLMKEEGLDGDLRRYAANRLRALNK